MDLAEFLEVPYRAIPMEMFNMSKRNQLWTVSNTESVAVNNSRLNLTCLGAGTCLPLL